LYDYLRSIEQEDRMRRGLIIAAILIAVAGAMYAELVADIRAARSALSEQHVVASNWSFLTADYNRVRDEMKQRYGERAETTLDAGNGWITVRLDAALVHEQKFVMTIENIFGATFIGPDGPRQQKFPFDITAGRISVRDPPGSLTRRLKQRFGKPAGTIIESLDERHWAPGACKTVEPNDLGFGWLAPILRLEAATQCLVHRKDSKPGIMLVLAVLARGDPWMRPFSRRICRVFGSKMLADMREIEKPNYFGCILLDRPERAGAREILTLRTFEATENGALAAIR
jgi:hypothetical protein